MPPSYWAYAWIDKLAALGITSGCGGGNYCPDNAATRAEMAIFLLRTKHGGGYAPPAASHYFADAIGHWAEAWIDQLYREGITSGCAANPLRYCPNDPVTRGPMAYLLVVTFNIVAYEPDTALAAAEVNSQINTDEHKSLENLPAPPIGSKVLAALLHVPLQVGINATIVYDGDGNRVKSTINGVTTYYVGNYHEKTGSTITKYYYAGAQRVAMRTGSTLYYLLSDHLGSTSLTMDANGNVISELRYKAWGEVRYAAGSTPTDYTYTGQYSYTADFGLMYYNARWYDPYLNRFAQADSIIPQGQGVQAWDRYAFVNNNPVRYTDPSGHCFTGALVDTAICVTVAAAIVGAVVDAGINAHKQLQESGQIDAREVFDHAWEGAAIGAAAVTGTLLAGVATAALLPAATMAGAYACSDGDCTNEAVAVGAAANNALQAINADGDPLNEIRTLGKAGETASGIIKNTERIPSLTGTASYRAPDQLLHDPKLISEVKNVDYLSLTNQLMDYLLYAEQRGYRFDLWTRELTVLSKPLRALINAGKIIRRDIP